MNEYRIFSFISLILLCTPTAGIHGPRPSIDTVLFSPKRGVEILETSNFKEIVYRSKFNHVVVFYQATCGTCQKFAPVFERLANYCKEWNELVKFGSVACSNHKNRPICQRFNIKRVPFIYFFHKDFIPEENMPIDIKSGPSVMLGNIARSMTNYYGRKQSSLTDWPNLLPLKKNDYNSEFSKYPNMFIVTTNDDYEKRLGPLAVLNSAKMKNARVRWMPHYEAKFLHIVDHPSLIQTNADNTTTILASSQQKNEFNKLIADKIGYKTDNLFAPIDGKIIMKPPKRTSIGKPIIPSGLHEQDLESSLYLTLWQEIPRRKHLNEDDLSTVKRFMRSLTFVPYRSEVLIFLEKVNTKLEKYSNISTKHFVQILDETFHDKSFVPRRLIWTGCSGSEPKYRGYSCSLWMTFHAMTIGGLNKTNVANIVKNIRDYVVKFYSCTTCAENFDKETADMDKSIGTTDEDAVLYLWRTHNLVNKRLSNDKNHLLDPRHPKLQFPSKPLCKECWSDENVDHFQQQNVLKFLKNFYSNVFRDRQEYVYSKESINEASFITTNIFYLYALCIFLQFFLTNL